MEQFFIREINFSYDDHYSYHPVNVDGWIIAEFDNYNSAQDALQKLEIVRMRKEEIMLFFFLHGYDSYEPTRMKVTQFFEKEFGITIEDWRADLYYLPKEATDEQVLTCKKILNVNFYKLFKLDRPVVFYKPIINPKFWAEVDYEYIKDEAFEIEYKGYTYYNSEEEALVNAPHFLRYWILERTPKGGFPSLVGTVEEISDNPDLLNQFLDGAQDFCYNSSASRIEKKKTFGVDPDIAGLAKLISLLKVKPYLLIKISLDEAKKLQYEFRNADGSFWYPDSSQ